MSIRHICISASLIAAIAANGQTILHDSISAPVLKLETPTIGMPELQIETPGKAETEIKSVMKPRSSDMPIFRTPQMRYNAIPYGQIAEWRTGGISAAMGSASMPGLMGVEIGHIWIHQSMGALTFAANADAIKYGYFRGLETQYGFSGSLTYDINEQFSATLFGSYHTAPHRFMTPAMLGYVSIPTIGGFLDWRINDRWGVEIGAQGYRSPIIRQWRIQPMVVPYFRLNKKAKLGIDVGGILYNIIESQASKHTGSFVGNPTIPPPIP